MKHGAAIALSTQFFQRRFAVDPACLAGPAAKNRTPGAANIIIFYSIITTLFSINDPYLPAQALIARPRP